jgi:galactokinase
VGQLHQGVLLKLRERGRELHRINGASTARFRFGAGLSSSAALEMATTLIVRELFPFTLAESGLDAPPRRENGKLALLTPAEKLRLAKVGQEAESEVVGVRCGLLDQISSMFGKEGHVIQTDFLTNSVQHDPMPPGLSSSWRIRR